MGLAPGGASTSRHAQYLWMYNGMLRRPTRETIRGDRSKPHTRNLGVYPAGISIQQEGVQYGRFDCEFLDSGPNVKISISYA